MQKKYLLALVASLVVAYFALTGKCHGAVKLRAIVEPNKQVLVLPFSSNTLQEEYQEAQELLLQTMEANVAASLQSYDIGAEQYSEAVRDWSRPQAKPALNQPAPVQLAPEQTASDQDTTTTPADMQQTEPTLLEQAKNNGYDYVLTAKLLVLQSEIKPTVQTGNYKMGSVRAKVNCSFRLTATDSSAKSLSGISAGQASKSIILEGTAQDKSLLAFAASQTVYQAVIAAAKNTARKLASPQSGDYEAGNGNAYGLGDVLPEKEYYQDSPGKTLNPAK
ncbi:MAG: hypothetical protein LBV76_02745 [Deltaproteobacteria bacterium]|jgi:hypothetical protein|nr:hypothetical protein [Deltaproteobacteria bacterium]